MFSHSVGHPPIVPFAVQELLVSRSPVRQLLVLSPEQLDTQKMFAYGYIMKSTSPPLIV